MQYFIILSQLILLIIFLLTLKCEVSKHCSDSWIFVSIRTLIMCVTSIVFCLLFESNHLSVTSVSLGIIATVVGAFYVLLETIYPSRNENNKEVYNDCIER
jgi:hypothetical protein